MVSSMSMLVKNSAMDAVLMLKKCVAVLIPTSRSRKVEYIVSALHFQMHACMHAHVCLLPCATTVYARLIVLRRWRKKNYGAGTRILPRAHGNCQSLHDCNTWAYIDI